MTEPSPKDLAADLHERARDLTDPQAALALYRQALVLDEARPETHYNIGLIHKYRGEWQASLEHNQQAVAMAPEDEAAQWNLAIAATALRDWHTARATWRQLGIGEIEEGDSPIEADFGMTPVRLNPEDAGEVVWARRIDPVRARIENVPYPESGFRHGDVVLHDGAEVGQRVSGGRTYPVFNVLALFESSDWGTWVVELAADDAQDAERAADILDAAGACAEVWSTNVRVICKQCSEGAPHEHHDQSGASPEDAVFRVGVAARKEDVMTDALKRWDADRQRVWRVQCGIEPAVGRS